MHIPGEIGEELDGVMPSGSFQMRDPQISSFVQQKLHEGVLWLETLITPNRSVPLTVQRIFDKILVDLAQTSVEG